MRHLMSAREGLTADELAERLAISRSAVDQQLKGLERDGYVERAQRPSTGGRPGNAYRLSLSGIHLFPKHYSLFSELLIDLIKTKSGAGALTEYLEALGVSLAQQFKQQLTEDTDAGRIEQTAELMQELGYEAHTVIATDSPLPAIEAHNCVYHHLASRHPEVCQLDLALLGALLDRTIEHTECMLRGGQACRFSIKVT